MRYSLLTACAIACTAAGPVHAGSDDARFLVVAPAALKGELAGFIAHKQHRLPTDLVTLEQTLADGKGSDDAESLKKHLYRAWKDRHVRYVLLVGDADVMPVRFMVLDRVTPEAFDYAFYPSDLYFADVARSDGSFDDWNADTSDFHAAYYGEVRGEKNKSDPMNFDRVSYIPELALGRWPVSPLEQVRTLAAKTIAYDDAMDRGEIDRAIGTVSPSGWIDARATLRGMLAPFKDVGWKIEERYFTDTNTAFKTAAPDEPNTVGMLTGGAALVLHAGHGSDTSWEQCFSLASLPKLGPQRHPAVMISAGCSTGRFCTLPPYEPYTDIHGAEHAGTNAGEKFTAPPPPPLCYARGRYNLSGLGEALVRDPSHGAVCYIGCNTGAQPCAVTLQSEFMSALAARGRGQIKGRVRVGDCWADAVAGYYEREKLATLKPTDDWYPASVFFQGMKFMFYGDPTVELPALRSP